MSWRLLGCGLVALLTCGGVAASGQTIDREAFLKAVAEVETGGNTRAIGSQGERGLYQFNYMTWRRYTKRAFVHAHDPAIAHDIAVQHFIWLYGRIGAAGIEPNADMLARAWNGGLSRALSGRVVRATRDYARRVSALVALHAGPTQPTTTAVASNMRSSASALAPIQLNFAIDDAAVAAVSAPEVVPVVEDSATAVSFNLASTRTKAAAPQRRFFFATIGE